MARPPKQWKKLNRVEDGGGYLYIGKEQLEELEEQGVLDADGEIEYSLSVGASDGRGRGFVGLRNREAEDEDE